MQAGQATMSPPSRRRSRHRATSRSAVRRGREHVARAANGADERPAALELATQVADMDVQRPVIRVVTAIEQSLRDLFPQDDTARYAREHFQEIELQRREIHEPAAAPHLTGGHVDPQFLEHPDRLVLT